MRRRLRAVSGFTTCQQPQVYPITTGCQKESEDDSPQLQELNIKKKLDRVCRLGQTLCIIQTKEVTMEGCSSYD